MISIFTTLGIASAPLLGPLGPWGGGPRPTYRGYLPTIGPILGVITPYIGPFGPYNRLFTLI